LFGTFRRIYHLNGRLFEKFSLGEEEKLKILKRVVIEININIKAKKVASYVKAEVKKRKIKKCDSKVSRKNIL
jgi:hypothetical protein